MENKTFAICYFCWADNVWPCPVDYFRSVFCFEYFFAWPWQSIMCPTALAGTHEQTTQHAIDGLVVAKVAADAVHGPPLRERLCLVTVFWALQEQKQGN